ncbi:class I adenylate-forming enzyme family protein [Alkalibacillus almallahensis]|uniref:class I adenylate-forming enzyme family protein n=1 Tax=Alkalibacillus almallahensis TaxID=1379154 RepID=UPI0014240074|nr:long-chain-fatty-acid--CoA ligase [Alkalibacillus almallahensis]NIK11838.1 acyl-CoA synthetase (AMP-forming)/AMP-acid ligase II [Alkalibacillus almallahensis]
MNLSELLAHQARKFPEHEALVAQQSRFSYKQWDDSVNAIANKLTQLGFQPGDKLIIHMPNVPEFMMLYIAVIRLKGIVIPINAKLTQPEMQYIIDHSEATYFATHELLFDEAKGLADENSLTWIKTGDAHGKWMSFAELLEGDPTPVTCDATEDDQASILYTSGTTGNPKGVVFTHRSILTVATMICIEMPMNKDSRVLHMMPLSHSAPLHLFMAAGLYVGATHVLAPTFTPDLLLQMVSQEKVTHFFGAPVAYLMTAKHPEVSQYDLSSMEYWVYGGAPLGANEVRFVQKAFDTDRLMCVYGLTEAGPNGTLLLPEEHDEKAGSIGSRAALNCEIRLVDENGQDVQRGEPGEIILRGEGTMQAYYKAPEKTAETLVDGWLYTGDIGMQDEDGYFWVIDRKKDVIISGGVNVFPTEIEKVIMQHPNVDDVAVIGVPHAEWGETVKAFVVTTEDDPAIEMSLTEFLQDQLASYKIPKLYQVVDAVPRNATGKLLRQQLREEVSTS